MHKRYSHVIVAGSVAFDDIMDFPSEFIKYFHPEKLHQINVSFVVDRLEKQLGGTGTNIAYNLSLLGAPVSLVAGVGKDADTFLHFLKDHGIDTSGILVDRDLYTATGKVITDTKGNQIWGFYYGACMRGKDIDVAARLKGNDLIVVSATHPDAFLHAQREAVRTGTDYLFDPGMAMTWIQDKDLREGIEHCTFLVGNDYEISQICRTLGVTVEQLLERGIAVVTTLGANGVKYQSKSKEFFVSGYKLDEIKDPTGAGDAWRGGFVAGLVNGLSLEDSLRQANALASFAVEQYGTVNHTPKKKDVEDRMKRL